MAATCNNPYRNVIMLLRLWLLSIVLWMTSASTNDSISNYNINDVVDLWIIKAQQAVQNGDYQTALQVYEKAIFIENITHIKLYNHFGVLLMNNMKNYNYSEKIFNRALQLSVELASNATSTHGMIDMDQLSFVYYNMGMCQELLSNFNQSKFMFEQAIAMNESVNVVTKGCYSLGLLHYKHFHDYSNAITMFEKVLELEFESNDIKKQACIDISTILLRLDHQFTLQRSQELFNKVTKVLGHNFVRYNEFGVMICQKYGAWKDARAIFVTSLNCTTSDSNLSIAMFNLAMIDQQNGYYTSATTFLKKAIQLNPLHMECYHKLGDIWIQVFQQYDKAMQVYIDALKIDPINTQLWQKVTEILNQHKVSFSQAYKLIDNTNNFQIVLKFSVILVDSKTKYDAARSRSLLLKCVSIDPTWSKAWYHLGLAQISLGQYSEAITSLNKSVRLYPDWNAYNVLGSIYSTKFGNIGKAQKMFERAIQLAPDTLSLAQNAELALCHLNVGLGLEKLYSRNKTQQLQAMYHFEQSITIDPQSCPLARVRYAGELISRGFDVDTAIETMKQGLKINPSDDILLHSLANMQTVTHTTDHNTIEIFRTAIYQLNTTVAGTYLDYAKYLFRNHMQLQTNHTYNQTTVQEIETMLYKAINLFSINASNARDQCYHQLALLKLKTLERNNNNEGLKNDQVLRIYQQGLNNMPNSCLLHVGIAHLLQNDYFKKYNQSVTHYQTAIQWCDDTGIHHTCIVNAIFNFAKMLIDNNDQYQLQHADLHNYLRSMIEQGCKHLIKGLNGAIFFELSNEWVGNFESTITTFANTNVITVDKSLIHETLGLYYESVNQSQQALMQFIMSFHYNLKNNKKNDLILVSHWKIGQILSRYSNLSNSDTKKAMKHFSIAVNQSSPIWQNFQLSELHYDYGYFLNTKMNDIWNAVKHYLKSVELNPFNIKAREQLDQIIEENQDTFSQFDKCALCLGIMIDSHQSIHTNNCTHRFHTNCIGKWYQRKKEKACPLCRKPQS